MKKNLDRKNNMLYNATNYGYNKAVRNLPVGE